MRTLDFRREDLDALARKLTSECDGHTPVVQGLEEKVSDLEKSSTSMSAAEAGLVASRLTHQIQVPTSTYTCSLHIK